MTNPSTTGRLLRIWLRDLVISLVLTLVVIVFLYQPVKVEGTSMLPELRDSDRVLINKFAYRFGSIDRGDVVVFYYPGDTSKSYIKRVIAGPGDTLRIDHGRVYRNGEVVPEPYVPKRFRDERSISEMRVPPGEYFVMGDHRSISSDSRDFGPVARNYIYGKALIVYWPTQELGWVR